MVEVAKMVKQHDKQHTECTLVIKYVIKCPHGGVYDNESLGSFLHADWVSPSSIISSVF